LVLRGSIQLLSALQERTREGRVENRAGAYRISLRATPFRGRPVAAWRAGGNWRRRCGWEEDGQAAGVLGGGDGPLLPSGVWRWWWWWCARLLRPRRRRDEGATPTPRGARVGSCGCRLADAEAAAAGQRPVVGRRGSVDQGWWRPTAQ